MAAHSKLEVHEAHFKLEFVHPAGSLPMTTLRDLERFCEALRESQAEGSQPIELHQTDGINNVPDILAVVPLRAPRPVNGHDHGDFHTHLSDQPVEVHLQTPRDEDWNEQAPR